VEWNEKISDEREAYRGLVINVKKDEVEKEKERYAFWNFEMTQE
jgi:hypothetical protein